MLCRAGNPKSQWGLRDARPTPPPPLKAPDLPQPGEGAGGGGQPSVLCLEVMKGGLSREQTWVGDVCHLFSVLKGDASPQRCIPCRLRALRQHPGALRRRFQPLP